MCLVSGVSAMAVCLPSGLTGECDECLNDVCLAIADGFVNKAGAVVSGHKPAAIFSIPMRAYCGGRWRQLVRSALDEALRTYADALPNYGVRLSVLYRDERRVYLLAWRPAHLTEVLLHKDSLAILREHGYQGSDTTALVSELRRRLVSYYTGCRKSAANFPHEIGVFLGYPAEDVRGFLEGRPATCKGPWRAYGDERVARRRFKALEEQERRCRSRFAAGETFGALFAPQGAPVR